MTVFVLLSILKSKTKNKSDEKSHVGNHGNCKIALFWNVSDIKCLLKSAQKPPSRQKTMTCAQANFNTFTFLAFSMKKHVLAEFNIMLEKTRIHRVKNMMFNFGIVCFSRQTQGSNFKGE